MFVAANDDQKTTGDVPLGDQDSTAGRDVQPVPEQPQHDIDFGRKNDSSDHPVPTAPERTPSPEPDHTSAPKDADPIPNRSPEPRDEGHLPDHTPEPHDEPVDVPVSKPKGPVSQHDDDEIPLNGGEIPGHVPGSPTRERDSSPVAPAEREVTPAEPFIPPVIRRPSPTSPEIVLESDVPEEFKVLIHKFYLLPTRFHFFFSVGYS